MLAHLSDRRDNFHVKNLRPHVSDRDWRDELHRKRHGYRRVAVQFHQTMQGVALRDAGASSDRVSALERPRAGTRPWISGWDEKRTTFSMPRKVDQKQAQEQLPELMREVAAGADIVIRSGDGAEFRLVEVKATARSRRFGSARGLIHMADDFDAPLEDFEIYER